MARQNINIGTVANDRTGDPLRIAFTKTNANFTELYATDVSINNRIDNLDVSDLSDEQGLLGGGSSNTIISSTILPYLELTNNALIILDLEFSANVSFTKEDNATGNSAIDFIDTGVSFTRENQGGLFNIETEETWDSGISPAGTFWNADGWDNLKNYKERDYVTFTEALKGEIGNRILDAELIMWDTINDKYYLFDFSAWTQGAAGGGFSYTRREIINPNFFQKKDYGSEVDILVEDDGEGSGIGITRGNNQGIFNPYREENWTTEISPSGTLWNIEGWDDFSNIQERTYTNFYNIYDGGLGYFAPGSKTILYIPDTNEYYAIHWISWTRGGMGGGFSYFRYKINLDQLKEGVKFSDGSIQKTAYIETNILSKAQNRRKIETRDGFIQIQLTELVTGNTLESALYQEVTNASFIQVNATTELVSLYQADIRNVQISLDENTWINARITGFSTAPVLRYFIETIDNDVITASQGQAIYVRSRSGAEPARWFLDDDLFFSGAILDFRAYSSRSGSIVGTIHISRSYDQNNITHTEVNSGFFDISNVDIWFRPTNEREIWARRLDGLSDSIAFHWHGKFFYGIDY
jgi:hypothetical protein